MKLKNTTDYPAHFLRRMVAWCCKQMHIKPTAIRSARFRNKMYGYSGHCYSATGDICVSVWKPKHEWAHMPSDRTNTLVSVTAHEVAHRANHLNRVKTRRSRRYGTTSMGGSEKHTTHYEKLLLAKFMTHRAALMAEWMAPPAPRAAKPKLTRQEQNAARALAALTRWERKLALAKTKVAAYRKRTRYYERAAAKRTAGTRLPDGIEITITDGPPDCSECVDAPDEV